MTPFMLSVQALLDGAPAPAVATTESRPEPVPVATDTQMLLRSHAEQLVSEANAVLREHGDVISLEDEIGPGELTFTLGYRDRGARVQSVLTRSGALTWLTVDGRTEDGPRRLGGADELPSLLLNLIGSAPRRTSLR